MDMTAKQFRRDFEQICSRSHGTCIWVGVFTGGIHISSHLIYPLRQLGTLLFLGLLFSELVVLMWQYAALRKLIKHYSGQDQLEWLAQTVWHWASFFLASLFTIFFSESLLLSAIYHSIAGYCFVWAIFRGTKTYRKAEYFVWKINKKSNKTPSEV